MLINGREYAIEKTGKSEPVYLLYDVERGTVYELFRSGITPESLFAFRCGPGSDYLILAGWFTDDPSGLAYTPPPI